MRGKKKLVLVIFFIIIILSISIFLLVNNEVVESMQARVENTNAGTGSTLVSKIQPSDYGKSTDYSVTVSGTVLNDWKIFYNDGSHVYLMLGDYLPNTLLPSSTGLQKKYTYSVYSSSSRTHLINSLTNTSYWSSFAAGVDGATATGAVTADVLLKSYNAKYGTNKTLATTSYLYQSDGKTVDPLYAPQSTMVDNCYGYWLATSDTSSSNTVWYVSYIGCFFSFKYNFSEGSDYNNANKNYNTRGVRPVVCLPTNIAGTVKGDTVTIGVSSYNLTINPNGGTWNGTTANSTDTIEERNN